MSTSSVKTHLFVVGMHRSGTSALCAALRCCGATFGSRLLDPMSGVNDEGFWEDAEVVELNDQILQLQNIKWYSVPAELVPRSDFSSEDWLELRQKGSEILQRGFGDGQLQSVKDPRFCITLPFWLYLCESLKIPTRVCVAGRAPLEVARSLEKRDGFPIGFGLRLYANYRRLIASHAPADALFVQYNDLVESPASVMSLLAADLPLNVDRTEIEKVVRSDLRHQSVPHADSLLDTADAGDVDLDALQLEIDTHYSQDSLVCDLADAFVRRGQTLSIKGVEFEQSLEEVSLQHIKALSTLDERDEQIVVLNARLAEAGTHLSEALAVIPERDAQIVDLHQRLEKIGAEHSYALGVINERDLQLRSFEETRQKLFDLPVIGRVIEKLWFREAS